VRCPRRRRRPCSRLARRRAIAAVRTWPCCITAAPHLHCPRPRRRQGRRGARASPRRRLPRREVRAGRYPSTARLRRLLHQRLRKRLPTTATTRPRLATRARTTVANCWTDTAATAATAAPSPCPRRAMCPSVTLDAAATLMTTTAATTTTRRAAPARHPRLPPRSGPPPLPPPPPPNRRMRLHFKRPRSCWRAPGLTARDYEQPRSPQGRAPVVLRRLLTRPPAPPLMMMMLMMLVLLRRRRRRRNRRLRRPRQPSGQQRSGPATPRRPCAASAVCSRTNCRHLQQPRARRLAKQQHRGAHGRPASPCLPPRTSSCCWSVLSPSC
jgi:hypothetical protein